MIYLIFFFIFSNVSYEGAVNEREWGRRRQESGVVGQVNEGGDVRGSIENLLLIFSG